MSEVMEWGPCRKGLNIWTENIRIEMTKQGEDRCERHGQGFDLVKDVHVHGRGVGQDDL